MAELGAVRARRLRAQIEAQAYTVDGEQVAFALLRRAAVEHAPRHPPASPGEWGTLSTDAALADRLALARAELHMDVAVLGEIAGEQEIAQRVVGAWPGVEDAAGLEASAVQRVEFFCRHLLTGRLPSAVGDVRHDPRTRDLPAAHASDVGAWMGVPLRTSAARLYVLCCLAHDRRPGLGPREVTRLRRHAATVGVILELGRDR